MMSRMIGIHQVNQLFAQPLDLPVIENPDAGQITVLVEKMNLIVTQAVEIPILPVDRQREEIADRFVMRR